MRYIRYSLTTLFLLIWLINSGIDVLAMNTGFSTETLPKQDIEIFLNNINIFLLTDEPDKKAIECFDVKEDKTIAIGYSSSDNKTISIYTDEGLFKYGYSFRCSGNFGIEWDNDELIIYFVRSDIALSVNALSEVKGIQKILNTTENNSYWNHNVFSPKRYVDGTEYTLKNDMGILNIFASSYSQLVTKNVNGKETIIYDVNTSQISSIIVIFIIVTLVICIIVWIVLTLFKKTGDG